MREPSARVTVHLALSLDGYIARRDGRVDWMETSDRFEGGESLSAESAAAFLRGIDCYVMGARTYEMALAFEAGGAGWAYGETPVVVLTHRQWPQARPSVEFASGELATVIEALKQRHREIWCVGGAATAGECIRQGLADELRHTILPVMIGDGIGMCDRLDADVPLHLLESRTYDNGTVALRYEVLRR